MSKTFFLKKEMSDFEQDGFVIVRGMYSGAEIADLSDQINRLVARGPELGKEMFYFEDSLLEKGKRVLSRIERFVDFDERRRFI